MERISKTTNCRRGQEDNPQSSLSVVPPPRHQNMESSTCSYLLTSLAVEKERDEQHEVFYSGHNSIRSTRSDESNSSSLLSAIHFAFNDDDSISSYPSLEEFFRQQEEEVDEDEIHIQSSLSFSAGGLSSRKRTPFNDDLCWIASENHNDEVARGPLRLQDDQVLQPRTDHTQQEESSPVSFFDQIQAEEGKEGKEDQAIMITPTVGDIIILLDDSHSHETPQDTDADDKMRSLMVLTPPPTNSSERPSIFYNVSDSTIGANTISSYNSSPTSSYNSSINSTGTLHHEESSCCLLSKSKKKVLPFYPPSFLIDQKSPQSYSTDSPTSSCRSSLLKSMKQTTRTQDLIRKEKKKIKLHDSFVDKDVLQELMYCMQDSKKSRDKLRQFLGGRRSRGAGGRTTTSRRYHYY
jgi:hypothetical protein